MKVIAVNGSPRKKWNTAMLLDKALEGAKSAGAEVEMVHLYDLDFKGCHSCFECKKIGGKSYGRCAIKDGLTPVLESIVQADALLLGTPIYFGKETGETRSFMERLLFPFVTYTPGYAVITPKQMPTAMVYTMNVEEKRMAEFYMNQTIIPSQGVMARVFGACDLLISTDTYQFSDYAKYLSTVWDAEAKAKRRAEVFPQDRGRAYDLGRKLAQA